MEMQLFKNIDPKNIPERMNNPFSYEPHPLCIEACKELQAELSQQKRLARGNRPWKDVRRTYRRSRQQ